MLLTTCGGGAGPPVCSIAALFCSSFLEFPYFLDQTPGYYVQGFRTLQNAHLRTPIIRKIIWGSMPPDPPNGGGP